MNRYARILFVGAIVAFAGNIASEPTSQAQAVSTIESQVPSGFAAASIRVNGAEIFYLRGGSGPIVVLIHGFPQDHTAWRDVAPALATHHTVIIPDLRGIGRSSAPAGGPYDALTLAEDIRQLLAALNLRTPYVVGHDMGGLVAFAYAAAHPAELAGAMLIENPLPGLPGWDEIASSRQVWHINFHQAPRVPEILLRGNEAAYFRGQFFSPEMGDSAAVDDAELTQYAAAYTRPSQLEAGLGQYRATDRNAEFNRKARGPVPVPLTLVATEGSLGPTNAEIQTALQAAGWSAVDRVTLPGRGHYLMDENPSAITKLIMDAAPR